MENFVDYLLFKSRSRNPQSQESNTNLFFCTGSLCLCVRSLWLIIYNITNSFLIAMAPDGSVSYQRNCSHSKLTIPECRIVEFLCMREIIRCSEDCGEYRDRCSRFQNVCYVYTKQRDWFLKTFCFKSFLKRMNATGIPKNIFMASSTCFHHYNHSFTEFNKHNEENINQ